MSQLIGITERGDAGLHFEWVDELPILEMAVLITKSINDKFIENVLPFKDKAIIHIGCTGMGGSVYEPNVPSPEFTKSQVQKLISLGFPVEQLVLRIDPIIPTDEGIQNAVKVLDLFSDTGIKRVRISVLDMYPHVINRFRAAGIEPPYTTFYAPQNMMLNLTKVLKEWENKYSFETCAEKMDPSWRKGCVSKADADILGKDIMFMGKKNNRTGCLCPMNKHEMLDHMGRCAHQCLYCFWKDEA